MSIDNMYTKTITPNHVVPKVLTLDSQRACKPSGPQMFLYHSSRNLSKPNTFNSFDSKRK